jgi:hypothetical protein
VAQVVEHLPSTFQTLNSNPVPDRDRERERERERPFLRHVEAGTSTPFFFKAASTPRSGYATFGLSICPDGHVNIHAHMRLITRSQFFFGTAAVRSDILTSSVQGL